MRFAKRIMAFIVVALSIVNLSACRLMDDRVPKTEIFGFVNGNHAKLSAFVEKYSEPNYEDFQKEFGSTRVVKSVYKRSEITKFSCGGTGLATNSTYICDMVFAIVRMRNYWLKFDSFNDKTLLAAIADPLVLILFVIYFVGIFKEKKVAKKQIAVSESDK